MRKLKEALKANVDTKAGVSIDNTSTNADIATTTEKKSAASAILEAKTTLTSWEEK